MEWRKDLRVLREDEMVLPRIELQVSVASDEKIIARLFRTSVTVSFRGAAGNEESAVKVNKADPSLRSG
jgi:hypothetical protein